MKLDRAPAGWRRATYADVMTETDERAGKRINLPVLSVTKSRGPMLASERFSKVMHARDLSKYRVAPRDFVVADPMLLWDGSIGRQRVVDEGLVSPDYRVYQPTKDVDKLFLACVVRSPAMLLHYQGGARGTNVRRNRIARSDFLAIPLPLPPLGEQRKIASILASMDDAIDAAQAVIQQLQVVKKAMVTELLARGLPDQHSRFKLTEIGEVPTGWEVVPIQSVIDSCDYGISKSLSLDDSGVPVLRMGNLHDGHVVLEDLKFVSADEVDPSLYLESGDVLFNRTNSAALVGKVGLFGGASRPVSFASYLLRLRPRKEIVDGSWLACVMHTDRSQAIIRTLATPGVSQVNVNRGRMLELAIPVAPLSEQREITAIVAELQSQMDTEIAALGQFRQLKSALMAILLTGELRVTPDPESV